MVQPGSQHFEGFCFVLMLRPLILHGHNQACGHVCDAHRTVCGVHMLPSRPRGSVRVYAQVFSVDLNIYLAEDHTIFAAESRQS